MGIVKNIIALLLLALVGCSKLPSSTWTVASPSAHTKFTVDQFVAVAMEYQGSRSIFGIDTYGPTGNAFKCGRSAQAAVSQSGDMLPHGHTLVTTCLHVKFGGPLPRGAALAVPIAGTPFEYVTIAVEYTKVGTFVGAQALHDSPDLKTCMRQAHDVIQSNYSGGQVSAGNSLLLYCTPVPVLERNSKDEGGIV